MKFLALTGTLALVAAEAVYPEPPTYVGGDIVLDNSAYDGGAGIPSPDKPCDKECKKAFKKAIRHQNKFSDFVSDACDDLMLIKSFPEYYSTQLVAGTKYYFGNFELSCGEESHPLNLEIVNQPWQKGADQWVFGVWNFVESKAAPYGYTDYY